MAKNKNESNNNQNPNPNPNPNQNQKTNETEEVVTETSSCLSGSSIRHWREDRATKIKQCGKDFLGVEDVKKIVLSDLPLCRRASLLEFLEKRRARVMEHVYTKTEKQNDGGSGGGDDDKKDGDDDKKDGNGGGSGGGKKNSGGGDGGQEEGGSGENRMDGSGHPGFGYYDHGYGYGNGFFNGHGHANGWTRGWALATCTKYVQ